MIFNMSEEDWDAVINVHLKGSFACTRPPRHTCDSRKVDVLSTSHLPQD
jgi:NAD(P)-dependent dehydrogenase (short-subunit alcohol dehydrogenase family)